MKKYKIFLFDSSNTADIQIKEFRNEYEAVLYARKHSNEAGIQKVIIENDVNIGFNPDRMWSEYENGEAVSWSYPVGLHQYAIQEHNKSMQLLTI